MTARTEMVKGGSRTCLTIILICGAAYAQARKWHAPTYHGLKLGRSKKADVERAFGKPAWSGHPEDEKDNPVASLLSYEYENVGGFEGRTVVIMDKRTGVVRDILLYPPDRKPLPLKLVIEKFGKDYIERDSDLGPCPTRRELRDFKRPLVPEHPIFLVYPEKGLYVGVDAEGDVPVITYMERCP